MHSCDRRAGGRADGAAAAVAAPPPAAAGPAQAIAKEGLAEAGRGIRDVWRRSFIGCAAAKVWSL